VTERSRVATSYERAELGVLLEAIEGASSLEHNNGTLLSHLVGVWRVLRTGGATEAVSRAGLIHSAYSTQFFHSPILEPDQRRATARIFGEEAENLAWLFCKLDRPALWEQRPVGGFTTEVEAREHLGRTIARLDPQTAEVLLAIECANFIDQGYPGKSMGTFHAWASNLTDRGVNLVFPATIGFGQPSENDEREAIELYSSLAPSFAPFDVLERVTELNPYAAEPYILLTIIALTQRDRDKAEEALREARARMAIFGASWDKRLNWASWMAIAFALQRVIEAGSNATFVEAPVDPTALLRSLRTLLH
jgi:hypothetical protein